MGYVIFFLLFVFFGTMSHRLYESIQKDDEKKGIIIKDPSAKYIGGFSDIGGGVDAYITVKEDIIDILIWGGNGLIREQKVIPMSIVTNAEIKSETQITQEVGLGKMVVFGALAFAMKNDKSTVMNYLVITCSENGNNSDLVFESRQAETIVSEIRRIKNIQTVF